MQMASTNLECDAGNTEDCFCNRVQLPGVNFLLILGACERTDLREDRAIFDRSVYGLLC